MDSSENSSSEKLFSIGEVIDLVGVDYPEITHSSLRFLEREGLVCPLRSSGNHRYFRESDIRRIKQIKEWQFDNYSLQEIRSRLERRDKLPSLERLADSFLHQLLDGSLAGARRDLLDAIDIGLEPEVALDGIITPAMTQIGNLWHDGMLSVAQEKIASEFVRDLISEMTRRADAPAPDGPCIVAACVEHEHHELGLRSIVAALQFRGLRVYYLGASVSPGFLLEAILLYRPAIVLLSAKLNESSASIRTVVEMITQLSLGNEQPDVLVGGDAADRHQEELNTMQARVISGHSITQAAVAIQHALDEKRRGVVEISEDSA